VDSGLAVVISLVLSCLALVVAIISAIYTRRQARAEEAMLAFERARHEEELRRLRQEQEVAQASRVFVSAYGRSDPEYQVLIENRSDAPIRELYAVVEPQHPGEAVSQGRRVLGLLRAGESAKPGAPVRGEAADDSTRVSVELCFHRRGGPDLAAGGFHSGTRRGGGGATRYRPMASLALTGQLKTSARRPACRSAQTGVDDAVRHHPRQSRWRDARNGGVKA
jgi:hypothetical protein